MAESMSSERAWTELLALGSGRVVAVDDERAGELVHVLNRQGEPKVVSWALAALADPDPWHRKAAAWVLGEHGYEAGRPFGAQTLPALVQAARAERDGETRSFIVSAIGHADDPAWVEELMFYANDEYPRVREVVAGSLPIMFVGEQMSPAAITALITLTNDPDPQVRDWATMSLGSQTDQDSDQIRAALRARLDDPDPDADTAGEAALGLARRHDPAVFTYLDRWLSAPPDQVGNLTVEAAGELGDTRLLPKLLALSDSGWQNTDPRPNTLADAIAALTSQRADP